jgi:hypothetical protein
MSESEGPIEAELTLFRPESSKTHRRSTDRYHCAPACAAKLFFPTTGETMVAWLTNLSVTGVALNLPRALEADLELVLQVRVADGGSPVRLAATVVHSTCEVDGTWRVGCVFPAPLSDDLLESLL